MWPDFCGTIAPDEPKYKARHAKHRIIEQRERQFAPRVMVVPVGSTVTFPNFDPVFHNVFSLFEGLHDVKGH